MVNAIQKKRLTRSVEVNKIVAAVFFYFISICTASSISLADWIHRGGPKDMNDQYPTLAFVGSNLFLGCSPASFGSTPAIIYRSTDSGATWSQALNEVQNFALSPSCFIGMDKIIIAGAYPNQAFISRDNGATWQEDSCRDTAGYIFTQTITSMVILSGNIIAGTTRGILRSTDSGYTWARIDTGSLNPDIVTLTVSNGVLYAGTRTGLIQSTDGGVTWTLMRNGLLAFYFSSVLVFDSTIYAAPLGYGVYRSTDLGGSWTRIFTGIGSQYVYSLSLFNGRIYATTDNGCFVLSDNGARWNFVKNGLPIAATWSFASAGQVAVIHEPGNGFYRTTDGGGSWELMDFGDKINPVISFEHVGSTLFAATQGGNIFKSTNGAVTWIPSNIDTLTGATHALLQSGGYLFAGTDMGVFRTSDNGLHWKAVNSGVTSKVVYSLATRGAALYAGTNGGVFISTDLGDNWNSFGTGIKTYSVTNILPLDTTIMITAMMQSVYRIHKSESFWTSVNWGISADCRALTALGERIIVGSQGAGTFFTTDEGSTWTQGYSEGISIFANSFSVNRGTVFACSNHDPQHNGEGGVFKSEDAGDSWQKIMEGLTDSNLVAMYISEDYLYLSSAASGVWRRALSEITGAEDHGVAKPGQISLSQNYPNPFNPSTSIFYELPESRDVKLTVFDVLGREVITLVNERQNPGKKVVSFNTGSIAGGLPSGVYFYKLQAGSFIQTRKLVLLR